MKRILIIAAVALGFSVAASAQPKAVGGNFSNGLEASYQHYLGDPNFLEVTAGLYGFMHPGFRLTGSYNFTFAQPRWTPRGEWGWYAGPGVAMGIASTGNFTNKFFFGIMGQVGLEYKFWFPLQLSADLRPTIGFCDSSFFSEGLLYGFVPTISVRYSF